MKKLLPGLAVLLGAIAFALFSQSSTTTHAYGPPPASNYYALRGGMKLVIELPPLEVVRPSQLWIAGEKFNFSNGNFVRVPTGKAELSVTARRVDLDEGSNKYFDRRDYYEITIRGFNVGSGGIAKAIQDFQNKFTASASTPPPASNLCMLVRCENPAYNPYQFKVTFAEPLRTTAVNYGTFLRTLAMNDANRVYLSDRTCANVNAAAGTTLCMKTIARLNAPGYAPGRHTMTHAVPVFGGISVEGNVVGTGVVSGFSFDENSQKAIAIGGTVTAGGGAGNNPQNYTQNATLLQWGSENQAGSVANKIKTLYDENSNKATVIGTTSLTDGAIFLNSKSNNLRNNEASTLSSPPEGKLWRVNGNLTLNNVTVNGAGTIMVDGNVTIDNTLSCATGTRLGIIASGTITFRLANANGKISCGAYVARGGNITFANTLSDPEVVYSAKGIFVASQSLKLPAIADDVAFTIKYDSDFAANPTVLFKELLNITFTTLS